MTRTPNATALVLESRFIRVSRYALHALELALARKDRRALRRIVSAIEADAADLGHTELANAAHAVAHGASSSMGRSLVVALGELRRRSLPRGAPRRIVIAGQVVVPERVLRSLADDVMQVDDGAAALALLATQRVAALVVSLDLPDMAGLDLVERVLDDPVHADVPVLVSGMPSSSAAPLEALIVGASEYLAADASRRRWTGTLAAVLRSAREDDRHFPRDPDTGLHGPSYLENRKEVAFRESQPFCLAVVRPPWTSLGEAEWQAAAAAVRAAVADEDVLVFRTGEHLSLLVPELTDAGVKEVLDAVVASLEGLPHASRRPCVGAAWWRGGVSANVEGTAGRMLQLAAQYGRPVLIAPDRGREHRRVLVAGLQSPVLEVLRALQLTVVPLREGVPKGGTATLAVLAEPVAVELLEQRRSAAGTPVVVVGSTPGREAQMFELGASEYIAHSAGPGEIRARLQAAVARA